MRLLLAALVLAVVYVIATSPDEVVVNDSGQVLGYVNRAREWLQGGRFWKGQATRVAASLKWELGEPARAAELSREIDVAEREHKVFMEEQYRRDPNIRPTPAEQQVDALRKQADEIENAEMERELEVVRLRRIAELRQIQRIVEARAQ